MGKFYEWQETKVHLNSAKEWIKNREKIHSQDGKRYKQVPLYNMHPLQYCGQAYAGANNYHESPVEFNKYLCMAFNEFRTQIEDRALELMVKSTNELGIDAELEVKKMLDEISKIKGE